MRVRGVGQVGLSGLAVMLASAGAPAHSATGVAPTAPFESAIVAAAHRGVRWQQTFVEAQATLPLRQVLGRRALTVLAIRLATAVPARVVSTTIQRDVEALTVTVHTANGLTAQVQENDAPFARSLWVTLAADRGVWVDAGSTALRLADLVRATTGAPAETTAAVLGVCRTSCAGESPMQIAMALKGAARAQDVEGVGGTRMVAWFGKTPGMPGYDMAGREVNLEILAARTAQGLVVAVGQPFVPPGWSEALGPDGGGLTGIRQPFSDT